MFLRGSYGLRTVVLCLGLFHGLDLSFGGSGDARSCHSLTHPRHGRVRKHDTTHESVATYVCDFGYFLVGDAERKCIESGDWSGREPSCQAPDAVECRKLADLVNGRVEYYSITPGSEAKYTCRHGYSLVGEDQRVCMKDGSWNGEEPRCKENCDDLEDPPQGHVADHDTAYGSVAAYMCDDGYSLVGDTTRTCEEHGLWSGSPPSCHAPSTPLTTRRLPRTTRNRLPILPTKPRRSPSPSTTKSTASPRNDQNKKTLYIGVGSGLGGMLILLILSAVVSVLLRKRRQKQQRAQPTEPSYSQPIKKQKQPDQKSHGKNDIQAKKGRGNRSNQSDTSLNSGVPPPVPLFLGMEKNNWNDEQMYLNMTPTALMDNRSLKPSKRSHKSSREKGIKKEENSQHTTSDNSVRSSGRQAGQREVVLDHQAGRQATER